MQLADCSPKTELLDARTTYQNLRRARVYAKNNVLKRLEIVNFEKLKSDVASGNLVLEPVTWSSGATRELYAFIMGLPSVKIVVHYVIRIYFRSISHCLILIIPLFR